MNKKYYRYLIYKNGILASTSDEDRDTFHEIISNAIKTIFCYYNDTPSGRTCHIQFQTTENKDGEITSEMISPLIQADDFIERVTKILDPTPKYQVPDDKKDYILGTLKGTRLFLLQLSSEKPTLTLYNRDAVDEGLNKVIEIIEG